MGDKTFTEKPPKTSFHIVRDILARGKSDSDEDTVITGTDNVRLSVMVAIPAKDIEEEEAPLEAIRKVNAMLKCLINKLPSVKIGLWNPDKNEKNSFITELLENVEIAEKYLYDYNIFISPGSFLLFHR